MREDRDPLPEDMADAEGYEPAGTRALAFAQGVLAERVRAKEAHPTRADLLAAAREAHEAIHETVACMEDIRVAYGEPLLDARANLGRAHDALHRVGVEQPLAKSPAR